MTIDDIRSLFAYNRWARGRSMSNPSVARDDTLKTYGRRLGDMLVHVANHATYHRGQTDFIRFVNDR
jgi:uncharacterized damage-inducible protein DinB